MNNNHANGSQHQDVFGRRVAARLDAGACELPHHITERLRAARVQALAQRKRSAQAEPAAGWTWSRRPAAARPQTEQAPGLWGRLATALPVVALAAGLVAISVIQSELRAAEVAEVDAALLTDDLPPAAYTDPGFVNFLKTGQ